MKLGINYVSNLKKTNELCQEVEIEMLSQCTPHKHAEQRKWCSVQVDGRGVHVSGRRRWGNCDLGRCSGAGLNTRTGIPRRIRHVQYLARLRDRRNEHHGAFAIDH